MGGGSAVPTENYLPNTASKSGLHIKIWQTQYWNCQLSGIITARCQSKLFAIELMHISPLHSNLPLILILLTYFYNNLINWHLYLPLLYKFTAGNMRWGIQAGGGRGGEESRLWEKEVTERRSQPLNGFNMPIPSLMNISFILNIGWKYFYIKEKEDFFFFNGFERWAQDQSGQNPSFLTGILPTQMENPFLKKSSLFTNKNKPLGF